MSRPWLAAGAVLVLLLGISLALGRPDDGARSAASTSATPAPTPTETPTATSSSGPRPEWYPLHLDNLPQPTLTLVTGEQPADDAVFEAGHEPNGPFWDGVAEWLIQTRLKQLTGRVEFNSEAGMFCAYGDRAALEQLGTAMAEIATDPARAEALIEEAEAAGVTFDD